ncbi:MAG: rhomboid family intramembrane serine protease [Rhodococcus sp.]|nr:rhomboid family intramembrane serine protease [Rhodococcus sp. (in: high G+C Gram-positive bacteria)]
MWAVVAVPSVLQAVVPSLLDFFERDPAQIRDGQWWRILTSALVQDGGLFGTVANLAVLAVVAPIAVQFWGAWRAVVLLVLGQVIFGLLTAFVFPSVGAGNSAATFTLAASMVGVVVTAHASRRELCLAAGVVLCGVLLVLVDDAHGLAVLTGTMLGAALAIIVPPSHRAAPTPALRESGQPTL